MINANREARTPTLSQEPGASARASGSTEEGERERGNGREGKVEARIGREGEKVEARIGRGT